MSITMEAFTKKHYTFADYEKLPRFIVSRARLRRAGIYVGFRLLTLDYRLPSRFR